jgi:hypothetical protein
MIRITSNLPNHALPLTALATFIYKHTLRKLLNESQKNYTLIYQVLALELWLQNIDC